MMKIKVREKTELKNLLKIANLVYSGGEAKQIIKDGLVKLNGETEIRPSKKLFDGDKVEFNDEVIEVTVEDAN